MVRRVAFTVLMFAAGGPCRAAEPAVDLKQHLVTHYTFDHPQASNGRSEEDQGADKTPLQLWDKTQRVAENAFKGSGNALRVLYRRRPGP